MEIMKMLILLVVLYGDDEDGNAVGSDVWRY